MKLISIRLLLAAVVLGFLSVAIPVTAQDEQSTPTSGLASGPTRPRSHGPVRGLIRHYDGTSSSLNWSGYAVDGSSFTGATGYWYVPAIACSKRPDYSEASFWVGIDGNSDPSYVEQTGTGSDCDGTLPICALTRPCYYAWYEFVGAEDPTIKYCFLVSPGDLISAEVSYDDSTKLFTTVLTDFSSGLVCNASVSVPGAPRSSAEWIVETGAPLADFGRASFTGGTATENSPSGPVTVVPGNGDAITLVSKNGNDEAAPSALTPDGTGFSVQSLFTVSNFNGANESFPTSPLVQGLDGNMYGTTFLGGDSNPPCPREVDLVGCGAVFQVTPTSMPPGGSPATIYSFCPNPSPTDCHDGSAPSGALVLGIDGNFYGVTAAYLGTVYKLSMEPRGGCPSGSNLGNGWCETTLYNFCSLAACADGATPYGALVQGSDGNFYGTTSWGGLDTDPYCRQFPGCGTVFKITPSGTLTTLYRFCSQANCADGATPSSGLVQGTDGNFYGMTAGGGSGGFGTLFRLSPAGELLTIHSFCSLANCADGNYPNGPLVQGSDGSFYGTTLTGGVQNGPDCDFAPAPGQPPSCGTVFKITPSGAFSTLYQFCYQDNCANGANPNSGLVAGADGNLYGTTSMVLCSVSPCFTDTIFEITPSGALTTLFANCLLLPSGQFCGYDYNNQLVQATDGSFYGTAKYGGSGTCPNGTSPFYCGTVFNFSVGLPPFIGLLPTSGVVGSTVTILGNGLASTSNVSIDGSPADFTVVSDTELKVVVPAVAPTDNRHASDPPSTAGFITVTTSAGTLTSNVPFRVAATTALALAPLSVPVGSTEPVVMTAQVTPPSGSNIPSGTVTFFNGPAPVGAATLTGGVATLNYNPSTLAAGTYSITALYGGDSTFGGSLSAPQALGVVSPDFTIAGSPTTVNVSSPGQQGTTTIKVTPSGGFTGNVTLTATITSSPSGAQDPPTLSFGSTSPVDITGTSAGTATLTISTTAATSGALANPSRPGVRWYATSSAGLVLALIFGMGIPTRRRSWRTRLGLLVFLMALIGGLLACGGGGSGGGGGGGGNPGTTPGTYTVTVTSTSGSITATGTVTLTVQ